MTTWSHAPNFNADTARSGYDVETAFVRPGRIVVRPGQSSDAILLDMMMPGLDGPNFAQLQDHPTTKAVPVVLLTAKAQESDRRRFAQLAVARVIIKPFDPFSFRGSWSGPWAGSRNPGRGQRHNS